MDDRYATLRDSMDENLRNAYDKYVDHIVRGCSPFEAALRVHIRPEDAPQWVRFAESDEYVIARKKVVLEAMNPSTEWSANTAIMHLLRLVENPLEKGSTKLNAIKELNVLLGITTVDAEGRTRRNEMSWEDVLRLAREKKAAGERVH
ncbi:hypothetical protein [Paraburkholderia phosphatilytica]|uniref:hypothetical protein n=1 Tax=Paraburkholderia phosphatilytica TaxID=2282883 RepID=UPI000E487051|nr:hypothetical protein [Paraburkholderia phosphatilytica]